jgi:hypothetical protein
VKLEPNQPPAGSASQSSGWFNSTSHIAISPIASEGWRFEGWVGSGEGSYTGPLANVTLDVSAPVIETMIFYPGLNISVNGNGYVTYTLTSSNTTVDASNVTTIYLPVGTEVVLSENPNSILFSFIKWTGEVNSTSKFVSLTLDKPLTEQANFDYNYLIIESIVGIVGAVVVAAYYVTSIRGKKMKLRSA